MKVGLKLVHWQNREEIIHLVKQITKTSLICQNPFLKSICRILFPKIFIEEKLKLPEIIKGENHNCQLTVNIQEKLKGPENIKLTVNNVPEIFFKGMKKIELLRNENKYLDESSIYKRVKRFLQEWKRGQFRY